MLSTGSRSTAPGAVEALNGDSFNSSALRARVFRRQASGHKSAIKAGEQRGGGAQLSPRRGPGTCASDTYDLRHGRCRRSLAQGAQADSIFVAECTFSHQSHDDPIVFPGQPGAAHSHEFSGAWSTNAFSTPASLLNSGSTCLPRVTRAHTGRRRCTRMVATTPPVQAAGSRSRTEAVEHGMRRPPRRITLTSSTAGTGKAGVSRPVLPQGCRRHSIRPPSWSRPNCGG